MGDLSLAVRSVRIFARAKHVGRARFLLQAGLIVDRMIPASCAAEMKLGGPMFTKGRKMKSFPASGAMSLFARSLAAGAVSALSLGCTLNPLAAREVTSALERYQEQQAPQAEAYALTPAAGAGDGGNDSTARLVALTSLREFIMAALQENPEIKQAEETAHAKAARIPQVTALPDPMLKTKTLPEPVRTAEGDNFFILGVSQKLPVPEKLDRAGRIALEETRIALQELERVRLRVIADVKRAYFQLYAIDKSIEITTENRDLMRGLIDVAIGQVEAGKRAQEDVLRAQVELSNLEAQLVQLGQRRITAVAMLNRQMDRPSATPIAQPADFDVRQVDARLEELFEHAVKSNPELGRIERQIERDREAVELARLAYWPDFTIGFEWMLMESREAFRPPPNPATGMRPTVPKMSEDASDNWAITFGLNIPIWRDKIEGGIREARRRLGASQQQYTSVRNSVYFRITDAFERVRSQRELADIFGYTIIPQAQQAYEVSRAGYVAGSSDFLYVIDNWQKWLVFRIQYHRILGDLERSVADLEQVLGMSLSEAGISK